MIGNQVPCFSRSLCGEAQERRVAALRRATAAQTAALNKRSLKDAKLLVICIDGIIMAGITCWRPWVWTARATSGCWG